MRRGDDCSGGVVKLEPMDERESRESKDGEGVSAFVGGALDLMDLEPVRFDRT